MSTKDQRLLKQGYRTTSSLISNSSDSYSSRSSLEVNTIRDSLIFNPTDADPFNQLLDDLTIIDDFIPDYNDLENEIEILYGNILL